MIYEPINSIITKYDVPPHHSKELNGKYKTKYICIERLPPRNEDRAQGVSCSWILKPKSVGMSSFLSVLSFLLSFLLSL